MHSAPSDGRILSIGSGGGLHEAFLAVRFPSARVVGVDLREPMVRTDLPNLEFLKGDLLDPRFRASLPLSDLVFSIECLEHIEDDESVLRGMADRVRPGGTLYLQVPFASEEEQNN